MTLTAIFFLLVYASGLAMALMRHPVFGLLTYVATFYLHPPGRWWGEGLPSFRWSLFAALVTFLTYLALPLKKRGENQTSALSSGIFKMLLAFTIWLWVQLSWALNYNEHLEFAILFTKYLVLLFLILKVVDSPQNLRLFLWTHVAGCFVMGWVAYTSYEGGRFEGFAPPNISEANAGALQLVTGVYTGAALFLHDRNSLKLTLFAGMPFIVNGIITTISRSGFLELTIGGGIFWYFTPKGKKGLVTSLAVLAVMGFIYLTSGVYWNRIDSIKQSGQEVEGISTGMGRLMLMKAQFKMFKDNPLGWGHRGTATLSPTYLDDRYLTSNAGGLRGRSSHNTFLSLLVEQGVPGAIFYIYLLWWTYRTLFKTRKLVTGRNDLVELTFTAIASGLGAIYVGDLFVDYLKLEVRFWFIGILLVLPALATIDAPARSPAQPGRTVPWRTDSL